MLLITCPYCGQRPELEFSYAGEAHIDRPVRPADLVDTVQRLCHQFLAGPGGTANKDGGIGHGDGGDHPPTAHRPALGFDRAGGRVAVGHAGRCGGSE